METRQFRVSENERRTEDEGDQQNEYHRGQTVIRDRLTLAGRSIGVCGSMVAGMQKAVLERPVFGQVHPAVVLLLPSAVPQLTNHGSGKSLLGQSGDPKPFVIGGMRAVFSLTVALALQYLFGAHHPHRIGMVDGEWQAFVSQS